MEGGTQIVIVDANRDSCVPDRQHLGRQVNFVNHMHMTLRAMPFEYQLLNIYTSNTRNLSRVQRAHGQNWKMVEHFQRLFARGNPSDEDLAPYAGEVPACLQELVP